MLVVWRLAVVAVAISIGHPSDVNGTSIAGPANPEHALDPLSYSHLVVECTIESVRKSTATNRELEMPGDPDGQKGILIAELSSVTLLRGPRIPKEVMVWQDLNPRALIGERLILCCYWVPALDLFAVWSDWLAFRWEGDRWVSLEQIIGLPTEERTSFTSQELRTLIKHVEIRELTRRAERIVIGRIAAVADSTVVVPHATVPVQRITLDVEDVFKGNRSTRTAWFFATGDAVTGFGNVVTPREFRVGEKWIVFLGSEGGFHYPLGGVNGLLLLNGQKVLFDRRVECSYTRSALARAIEEVISE